MTQTPALLKPRAPADLNDPFEREWAESEATRRPGSDLTKGMARVWYEKGLGTYRPDDEEMGKMAYNLHIRSGNFIDLPTARMIVEESNRAMFRQRTKTR